ncbi:transglutaminaseTgpA domain-containing protein [Streptomyces sp. NPDC049040]|uniref:transglutaminase family protein n=1 Tax=Streptomyces sp. NPDC049040 TaxID=3365593 RepID=UPI00372244E5
MSGRARLTVFAALASLMAAAALLPLATPRGWFFKAILCVALQAGVGAAARRVPLARPLTVLAQLLVSVLVLTVMFTPHQAIGGVLPGPTAFRQFGRLVQDGMTDVTNFAIPAPVTPGIRFLLVGGVVLIALTVDAIAVTYNSAAPAGLPLLALYAVAAGLEEGGSQWLYFLIAAAGYLLLLLAEGRDRLSRWGRVFGGAPRQGGWSGPAGSAGGGAPLAPVRTGRRIGAMALGIALVLPAVLPSLSGGLLDAKGSGSGDGLGGGIGNATAVRPEVALQDYLNQPDNREVMTYKTDSPDAGGMYLRILSLDQFDGTQWSASKDDKVDIPDVLPTPQGQAGDVRYTEVDTSVAVDRGYEQGWLPMPYPALRVQADGDWRYEPEGRMVIGEDGQTTAGLHYQVTSMQLEPTAAQLAAAPPATGQIADKYEKVPGSLPGIVAATARQVTRNATTDYQRALDLQQYFTSGQFVYNTEATSGTGVDAIAHFLQTKQGFCVHFAFTMAAMARTLHIPARVAVGFTPGSLTSAGTMSVGFKDAHAWPELYFEGIGWTRFEPTPYRGSPPSYTVSTSTAGGGNTPDPTQHGTGQTPRPNPSTSSQCGDRHLGPASCGAAAATGSGGSGGSGIDALRFTGLGLAALLVLLLPTLPLMWRSRVRSKRLGGGREKSEGLVLSAWQEVLDTGWDYGIPPDESETPRRAMARLIAQGQLGGAAAASANSLATAVERTLYAPRPQAATGLAGDVNTVRAGLHAAAGRSTRLRARYLPRSFARVMWRLSASSTAASERVGRTVDRLAAPLRRRTTRDQPS